MKKTLWALISLLLLLAVSGCAVEEPQQTTAPPVEVQTPYEAIARQPQYQGVALTMQASWQRADPEAQVLLQAAAVFEKKTGAQVTILWPGEGAAVPDDDAVVDIFQISAEDFSGMRSDYVLNLTQMAEQADYDAKSHPVLRTQIIGQWGFLGAVAQTPYLGGVYYNADVFAQCAPAELPQSWDDFLKLCQSLYQSGWQPLTLDQQDALLATELHLRRSIGAGEIQRLMGADGHWYDDQPAMAALEQVMHFRQAGFVATGTPAEYPAGQNKMALSNSAMMIGTNQDCADVEAATRTDLNWGVFPYPGSTGSGTWMSADVLVIHRDTAHAQAAFDFVMLLATGEFDQLRADISCGIPADPANASPIAGAMEAMEAAEPEPLRLLGSNQLDVSVKLWSGWYDDVGRYASRLESSK